MSQKESSLRSAQSELNKLRGELKQKKAAAERAESALKQKLDLLNHKYEDATAKVRDLEVRLEQTEATLEETTEALSVEEGRVRELEASSVAKTEHHTLKKYFHAAAAAAALLLLCLIISLATGGAGKGGGASEAADAAALEREYMSSISNLKSEHTELLEELSREKAALQLQVEAHSNSSTSHGQKVNELAAMVDEHKNECNALRQSLHTEKSEKEKLHKELHTAHEEQKQELVQTHQETVEMHESKIAELLAAHEAKHALLQATEDKLSRHLTSTAEAGRRLLPGEILDKGEFLRNDCESVAAEAACVEHYLEVTSNGNVVIYRGNPEADAGADPEAGAKVEVWATKTARKPVKARFWHKAETAAEPHHEFRLRRDGVLIVVDTDRSKIMWKSTGKTQPKGNYRAFIDTEGSLLVELNGEVVWRNQ
uniref:Bulb-type lectin domain-containing protein n=1 Tax=Florenciella parvula TaxID=236787 RepID=A0A7S2FFC9_9STRA|mmetsp:Transcript_15304/g.32029  ORF Transcript_15304/g.32029 Transcript_15304/m.32029 type:complete len:428 (+) Transcript_15304:2-1285(+)